MISKNELSTEQANFLRSKGFGVQGEWNLGDVGFAVDPIYVCGNGHLSGNHISPRTIFTIIERENGFFCIMLESGETCWILSGGPARVEKLHPLQT